MHTKSDLRRPWTVNTFRFEVVRLISPAASGTGSTGRKVEVKMVVGYVNDVKAYQVSVASGLPPKPPEDPRRELDVPKVLAGVVVEGEFVVAL